MHLRKFYRLFENGTKGFTVSVIYSSFDPRSDVVSGASLFSCKNRISANGVWSMKPLLTSFILDDVTQDHESFMKLTSSFLLHSIRNLILAVMGAELC